MPRVSPAKPYAWGDPLAALPRGDEQRERLCAREGDDLVRSLFCDIEPPQITSLAELQRVLGIYSEALGSVRGLAVTAHSTSLGARSISSINPRAIAIQFQPPEIELLALAFTRGEQFSEIVVRDRNDGELRFYLFAFRQACNDSEHGCVPGDLLTPEIEQNWLQTSLYDEHDLQNTVLDCATCHQPEGPGSSKLLRMQELNPPWTHWIFSANDGGRALLVDYRAAKSDEQFFGMPGALLQRSNPINLNVQVTNGDGYLQPNMFDSAPIEDEVIASAAALGGAQPADNSIPGQSATWREGYERFQRGEAITFPYHDVKVTDPAKLERMTAAYRAYRNGELERSALPDIRDVFPDDPQRLAEMGFATEPGMSGEAILLQSCAMCHNDRLDQSLSRARFRASLTDMDRREKDLAIARLQLPDDDPLAMPPPRLRILTPEARATAIEALRR